MRYISITALSFVIRYLHLWGASQRDGLAHTLGAAGREAYLEPLVLEDFFTHFFTLCLVKTGTVRHVVRYGTRAVVSVSATACAIS